MQINHLWKASTQAVCLCVSLFPTSISADEIAADGPSVMLVLDASGSMWGQVGDRHKIEIAREVVGDLMADWDAKIEIGLIAYGHNRKGDCGDIETLVPVGPDNQTSIRKAVNALNPKGKTPLSDAVRSAANHLAYTEEPATVILVTDGIETCNADPCRVAEELEQSGVDFKTHVVGFDLAPEERQALQCVAKRTGGQFFDAQDASQLSSALRVAAKEVANSAGATELHVELFQGAGALDRGWDMQQLHWSIHKVGENGVVEETSVGQATGTPFRARLDDGDYVARITWDAISLEHPFQVGDDIPRQHVIDLNAAFFFVESTLADGAEALGNVLHGLFQINDDGSRGDRLSRRLRGYDSVWLTPAGKYFLYAKHGEATLEELIEVQPGDNGVLSYAFDAGVLKLTAVDESGSPVRGNVTWRAFKVDEQGERHRSGFKSGSRVEFVLSAGAYVLALQLGDQTWETEVQIAAGDDKAVSIELTN